MKHIELLCQRHPELVKIKKEIEESTSILIDAFRDGKKLLVCGNGGSASDAQHIVGELMKDFVLKRKVDPSAFVKEGINDADRELLTRCLKKALPAVALCGQSALETAYANDVEPKLCFAQQVFGLGNEGDVLLGISTSGNSENVRLAALTAKAKGMKVISLTGETGGALKEVSDVTVRAPKKETYQVQELHLPIYHAICLALEEHFFGGNE